MNPGTDVYIMSHEAKSTKKLFEKILLYNETMQKEYPLLAFGTEIENRTELEFTNKSTYSIGTAGEANTGRSQTIKLFHGSEPAFWDNADEIKAGALQTVALAEGTEIILETTVNGLNWFYKMANASRAGSGVYELIFIPWIWTEEYALGITAEDYPEGFELTEEEIRICEVMKNVYGDKVTKEQLNWRRAKVVELGDVKFRQEYPNTYEEAFQSSGQSFYDMSFVYRAMNNNFVDTLGARIIGVDVGRNKVINPDGEPDRTVLAYRKGRSIYDMKTYKEMTATNLAGILADEIDHDNCDHIFIDRACGEGAYDILCDRGYGKWITLVDFGESPMSDAYANKRAEMACLFDEWLRTPGDISIVKRDDISADISMMPYWKQNAHSRKVFPSKDKMRDEFGRSPDILDAIMLTFAYPVSGEVAPRTPQHTANTRNGSSLYAQQQLRGLSNRGGNGYNPGRRYINKVTQFYCRRDKRSFAA